MAKGLRQAVMGAEAVIRNIRARHKKMGEDFERGLVLAGAHLLKESQRKVPVDTGNLKASGYFRKTGTGWKANGFVGYTAFYAPFVHELVQMKLKGLPRPGHGNFWDPPGRGQAKFLEEPARVEAARMRAIIREAMRIK